MTVGPEIHRDAASQEMAHVDTMIGPHLRLTRENIQLRDDLNLARQARDSLRQLIEVERQGNAELHAALDTERLLRTNDRATIADLERRLREAEGQLKAQTPGRLKRMHELSASEVDEIRSFEPRWVIDARKSGEVLAENAELRRTLGMVGKYLDELKELVNDPANPNGKP